MEFKHFLADLEDAERRPRSLERLHRFHLGYIEDVLEALSWMRFDPDDRSDAFGDEVGRLVPAWNEPAINARRDVGRNDPCPCGSGKKYKKCCLGKAQAG
jgi:hypothetical protein